MPRAPNMRLTVGRSPSGGAWGDFWFDTTERVLKIYDADNGEWVNILEYAMNVIPYTGDETEVNAVGVAGTSVKTHRFLYHGRTKNIKIVAELRASAGTTAYLDVYIEDGLALTLSTTSTTYEVVSGVVDISKAPPLNSEPVPSAGHVYLVDVRLRNSDAGGTTTNRLYDFYYTS